MTSLVDEHGTQAALRTEAVCLDRRDDPLLTPAAAQAQDQLGDARLELLVRDFARVLNCEVAFVCEKNGDDRAHLLATLGVDSALAITLPKRGGRRQRSERSDSGGCFVGRAVVHGRPAFDAIDCDRDADLISASRGPLTHVLSVPVQLFGRGGGRSLVAGFSVPPRDLTRTFWIADSYARLVALIMSNADAFGGLLRDSWRDGLAHASRELAQPA